MKRLAISIFLFSVLVALLAQSQQNTGPTAANITGILLPFSLAPTNSITDGMAVTLDHGTNKWATVSGSGGVALANTNIAWTGTNRFSKPIEAGLGLVGTNAAGSNSLYMNTAYSTRAWYDDAGAQFNFLDPISGTSISGTFSGDGAGLSGITFASEAAVADALSVSDYTVASMTAASVPGFNGDGSGLSNVIASATSAAIQTNWISGRLYTNNSSADWLVRASANLGVAAVSGNASLWLQSGAQGGTMANLSGHAMQTLVTSIAMTYTNEVCGIVSSGLAFCFTNLSNGAGNSSGLVAGTGQRKQF